MQVVLRWTWVFKIEPSVPVNQRFSFLVFSLFDWSRLGFTVLGWSSLFRAIIEEMQTWERRWRWNLPVHGEETLTERVKEKKKVYDLNVQYAKGWISRLSTPLKQRGTWCELGNDGKARNRRAMIWSIEWNLFQVGRRTSSVAFSSTVVLTSHENSILKADTGMLQTKYTVTGFYLQWRDASAVCTSWLFSPSLWRIKAISSSLHTSFKWFANIQENVVSLFHLANWWLFSCSRVLVVDPFLTYILQDFI